MAPVPYGQVTTKVKYGMVVNEEFNFSREKLTRVNPF